MQIGSQLSIDITPKIIGLFDLISSSDGIYEIQEVICGTTFIKTLLRGNMTNFPIYISTGNCIQIRNILDRTISIQYNWQYNSTGNNLLFTSLFFYFITLILVFVISISLSIFSGCIVRHIYEKYIKPKLRKDICKFEPIVIPDLPEKRSLPPIPMVFNPPTAPQQNMYPEIKIDQNDTYEDYRPE